MKDKLINILLIVAIIYITNYMLNTFFLTSSSVFERSIQRLSQVSLIATDESGSTRLLVYERLFENIYTLGFGTFSDQNYSKFFESSDISLLNINPHSFIVEMSFLYGWVGLFFSLGMTAFIFIGIIKNRDLSIFMRCMTVSSLIIFQSVPSSILGSSIFFLPYILLMYLRKKYLSPTL